MHNEYANLWTNQQIADNQQYILGVPKDEEQEPINLAGYQVTKAELFSHTREPAVTVWNDRIKLAIKSEIDPSNDANRWKGRFRLGGSFVDFRGLMAGGLKQGGTL